MYDATPIQCIAHGTVTGSAAANPLPFTAEGVLSITRTSAGLTVITLDPGMPGGGAVPIKDSRIFIQPLNAAQITPFPLSIDSTVLKGFTGPGNTGTSTFTVQIWVTPAEPVDIDYDFIIFRAGEAE
jgi:hypothetical protein